MFDFDKALMKFMAPFAALLTAAICVYFTIRILELIWLQLLILVAIFGVLAGTVVLLWWRFRRW